MTTARAFLPSRNGRALDVSLHKIRAFKIALNGFGYFNSNLMLNGLLAHNFGRGGKYIRIEK